MRKVNQKVEGPGIRGCLADWAKGVALPSHCVYMGRTMGTHGRPLGWGNPFRVNKDTESEREIAVERFRDYLQGKEGRWLRYRLHELRGMTCVCHCRLNQACHVDEILKSMEVNAAMGAEGKARIPQGEGMSLGELGLALRAWLLRPESDVDGAMLAKFVRRNGIERGETSKDLLPFPLSSGPSEADIALSLAAAAKMMGWKWKSKVRGWRHGCSL